MLAKHCGPMDVDMTSDDKDLNAWCGRFRPPARSAFEGPLAPGRLWWVPRVGLIAVVQGRIRRSMREGRPGTHVRLLPARPWRGRLPRLGGSSRVFKSAVDSDLFIERPGGFPRRIPNDANVKWVVMSVVEDT